MDLIPSSIKLQNRTSVSVSFKAPNIFPNKLKLSPFNSSFKTDDSFEISPTTRILFLADKGFL